MFDFYHRSTESLIDVKSEVEESDFDNLDRLYTKSPFIQREIEQKLTVPLKSARISSFCPNTGGIWIPFVGLDASDKKAHIERASIGVSFTPIEVRIGLNFGVSAYQYRAKYYELILSGALAADLESLSNKATGYCLCDTFWHYHIRNVKSLQWALTMYGSTKLALENAIKETQQLEGTPLTGHRYLVSKVIQRRPEDFAYILKGILAEVSKGITELYPVLSIIDKK